MTEPRPRVILHVDMDAFYAAVEKADDPALGAQAVIVGGLGRRGVVATADYLAREFGVRSAMPMSQARKLCPQARFLAPRMDRYREVSRSIFAIFQSFTPQVEGLSLDEAFLDLTGSLRLFGAAEGIARRLKSEIRAATGLTASVGVARNKFLAKLASELRKPDGLVLVPEQQLQGFLDPMPINRLWGIGPRTAPRLRALGILTFGQLRRADPAVLQAALGKRWEHFRQLAAGEDEREVVAWSPDRSISHETTFEEDLTDTDRMLAELMRLAEGVGRRLRAAGLVSRTIVLKIRDRGFKTVSRSRSLRGETCSTGTVYQVARALLLSWRAENRSTPVRLLGVAATALEPGYRRARSDDSEETPAARRLDEVVDSINRRFGEAQVVRGLTLRRPRTES